MALPRDEAGPREPAGAARRVGAGAHGPRRWLNPRPGRRRRRRSRDERRPAATARWTAAARSRTGLAIDGIPAGELADRLRHAALVVDADDLAERMRAVRGALPACGLRGQGVHVARGDPPRARRGARPALRERRARSRRACGPAPPRDRASPARQREDRRGARARRRRRRRTRDRRRVDELRRLDAIARGSAARSSRFLLRVIPEVVVETHEAIATGHELSKFGTPRRDRRPRSSVRRRRCRTCVYEGLHAHAGSQVLDPGAVPVRCWRRSWRWRRRCAMRPASTHASRRRRRRVRRDVRRRARDRSGVARPDAADAARRARARCADPAAPPWSSSRGAPSSRTPPSRSTASSRASGRSTRRKLVAVDGGMSDNLRPMLYDAAYAVAPVRPGRGSRAPIGRRHDRRSPLRVRRRARRAASRSRRSSGRETSSRSRRRAHTAIRSHRLQPGRPAGRRRRPRRRRGAVAPARRRRGPRPARGLLGAGADEAAAPPEGVAVRRATPRDAPSCARALARRGRRGPVGPQRRRRATRPRVAPTVPRCAWRRRRPASSSPTPTVAGDRPLGLTARAASGHRHVATLALADRGGPSRRKASDRAARRRGPLGARGRRREARALGLPSNRPRSRCTGSSASSRKAGCRVSPGSPTVTKTRS